MRNSLENGSKKY